MAVRYRDLVSPALIDTNVPSNGNADTAATLAQALGSFGNTVSGIGQQVLGAQGHEAGTAAGLDKSAQPVHGWKQYTAYNQAYNSAAEAAYSARTQVDIADTADRLELENEANLPAYQAKSQAYADGLLKAAPPEYRARIQLALDSRLRAGAKKVESQQIAKQKDDQQASYIAGVPAKISLTLKGLENSTSEEADAAIMTAVDDNDKQLQALVKDNVITAVHAEKLRQGFHAELDTGLSNARVEKAVGSMMDLARANVEKGDAALADVERNPNLSEDEKVAVRKYYEQGRNQLFFERSRQYAEASVALAGRLASGAAGPGVEGAARDLYRKGAISVDEFQSSIAASRRNAKQHIEDGADRAAVVTALQGGMGLDPTDPAQRKAAESVFSSWVAQAGAQPGDERWQAAATEFIHSTNILPESAKAWARVSMLSGDPAQAVPAAAFFERVQKANSSAWEYQSEPKLAAFAGQMNQYLAAGVDPKRAYDIAHRNAYELTDAQREMLRNQFREGKLEKNNDSELHDALKEDKSFNPSMFSRIPAMPLAMRAEYGALTEQLYTATNGDEKLARQLAAKAVTSHYGISEVNGRPEIMKYAPEKMYPGATADVIRVDMADAAKAAGVTADPASIRLVPHPDFFERSKGRVWALEALDADGVPDMIRGPDNRPVPYGLPFGSDFTAARKAALQKKVDEAKAERDRQITPEDTNTISENLGMSY